MSQEAKPPYVTFEVRAVEDRAASIEAGHYCVQDVHYAIITPAGTKDRIEKVAEEWLRDLEGAVREERFPAQWLQAYRHAYKVWCETQEVPLDGTSIRNWAAVSPAQAKMLLDLHIMTVEQLAEATEEAIVNMGMGGRALKAKAQAYLEASAGPGKVGAELEAMRQEIAQLKTRDEAREAELKRLQLENDSLRKSVDKK